VINWLKDNLQSYHVTKQVPYIFSIWLPFHALALSGIGFSILHWSWAYLAYFLAGWAIFGGVGTAIMLHRYSAHGSIEIRRWQKPMLYWIACMAGQGSPIWWAALHRGYHHAHSDREKDVHSPTKGFWHAYMGWMFGIKHNTVNLKYGANLLRDQSMLWFHVHYNKVVWASLVLLFLIDPMFCIWFYVIPAMIDLHTDSMVNSLCHTNGAGYRPFETKDQSQNVWYLGLFGWGQGWHNNHHTDPKSYDFGTSISKRWYEIDPCLLLVPFIAPWSETKRLWKKWRQACAG